MKKFNCQMPKMKVIDIHACSDERLADEYPSFILILKVRCSGSQLFIVGSINIIFACIQLKTKYGFRAVNEAK